MRDLKKVRISDSQKTERLRKIVKHYQDKEDNLIFKKEVHKSNNKL